MNILRFFCNPIPQFTMANSTLPSELPKSLSTSSPTFSPTSLPSSANKVVFYMGAGSMCEENEVKFTPQSSPPPLSSLAKKPAIPLSNLYTNDAKHVTLPFVNEDDNDRDAFIIAFNPLTPLK